MIKKIDNNKLQISNIVNQNTLCLKFTPSLEFQYTTNPVREVVVHIPNSIVQSVYLIIIFLL